MTAPCISYLPFTETLMSFILSTFCNYLVVWIKFRRGTCLVLKPFTSKKIKSCFLYQDGPTHFSEIVRFRCAYYQGTLSLVVHCIL
jgi:hypothetical protein